MADWIIYGYMVATIILLLMIAIKSHMTYEELEEHTREWRQEKIDRVAAMLRKNLEDTKKKIEEAEEATMPNSCRSIIKKCRHKEAISEQEEEKLLRNLRSKELIGAEWFRSLLSSFGYNRTGRGS